MTHRDALQAAIRAGGARHAESLEHVASCCECAEVLRALETLVSPVPAPDSEPPSRLFGCDAVQDELPLLLDGDVATRRSRHPEAMEHLGWCVPCREQMADLLAFSRGIDQGDIPDLFAPVRWRDVVDGAGRRIRALVGGLIIGIRDGVAGFVDAPGGLLRMPMPLGHATRGPSPRDADAARFGGIELPLGAGRTVTVVTRWRDEGAVVEARCDGLAVGTMLSLRQRVATGTRLIGARTLEGVAVTFGPLPVGQYVLEILEPSAMGVHVDIEVVGDD